MIEKPKKRVFKLGLIIPAGAKRPKGVEWFGLGYENDYGKYAVQFYSARTKNDAIRYYKRILESRGCLLESIHLMVANPIFPLNHSYVEMSTKID